MESELPVPTVILSGVVTAETDPAGGFFVSQLNVVSQLLAPAGMAQETGLAESVPDIVAEDVQIVPFQEVVMAQAAVAVARAKSFVVIDGDTLVPISR